MQSEWQRPRGATVLPIRDPATYSVRSSVSKTSDLYQANPCPRDADLVAMQIRPGAREHVIKVVWEGKVSCRRVRYLAGEYGILQKDTVSCRRVRHPVGGWYLWKG